MKVKEEEEEDEDEDEVGLGAPDRTARVMVKARVGRRVRRAADAVAGVRRRQLRQIIAVFLECGCGCGDND